MHFLLYCIYISVCTHTHTRRCPGEQRHRKRSLNQRQCHRLIKRLGCEFYNLTAVCIWWKCVCVSHNEAIREAVCGVSLGNCLFTGHAQGAFPFSPLSTGKLRWSWIISFSLSHTCEHTLFPPDLQSGTMEKEAVEVQNMDVTVH